MAAAGSGQVTGVAITFDTGFFAEVLNIDVTLPTCNPVETTHSTTAQTSGKTYRTFTPSELVDAEGITVTVHYQNDDAPLIGGAAETVTITWPTLTGESSAHTYACSGFITGGSATMNPMGDELATGTYNIKFTGAPTFTAAT